TETCPCMFGGMEPGQEPGRSGGRTVPVQRYAVISISPVGRVKSVALLTKCARQFAQLRTQAAFPCVTARPPLSCFGARAGRLLPRFPFPDQRGLFRASFRCPVRSAHA